MHSVTYMVHVQRHDVKEDVYCPRPPVQWRHHGFWFSFHVKLLLRVLCGSKTAPRPLRPAAPPPRCPSRSVKRGQRQRSSSRGKTPPCRRIASLTVPSCGKRLNETGIIIPRTKAALMCRTGAASRALLWKSLVLWREIYVVKSDHLTRWAKCKKQRAWPL